MTIFTLLFLFKECQPKETFHFFIRQPSFRTILIKSIHGAEVVAVAFTAVAIERLAAFRQSIDIFHTYFLLLYAKTAIIYLKIICIPPIGLRSILCKNPKYDFGSLKCYVAEATPWCFTPY